MPPVFNRGPHRIEADLTWTYIQQEREVIAAYHRATELAIARQPPRKVTVASEKRARGLLESMLTARQLATLRNSSYVDVLGSVGGHYRVFTDYGISHNVYALSGRAFSTFCYHLSGAYPLSDHLMAQLMIIRTEEPSLLLYPQAQLFHGWRGHAPTPLLPPYTPWSCG